MPSSTKSFGAGHEDSSFGSIPWASYGSGPDMAFSTSTLSTYYNVRDTFGFALPTTAVVLGIEGTLQRFAISGGHVRTARIRAVKGGAIGATELKTTTTEWAQDSDSETVGGPTDLCGETWSYSDINASNFGFALSAGPGVSAGGDCIFQNCSVTVYYSDGPDVGPVLFQTRRVGMWYFKKSTASQEMPLGPFLDDTDGKTPETGLSIANTDIKLFKAGATSAVSKNSGGATHDASGNYYAVFDATDTDIVGPMKITVQKTGALSIVVEALVLDSAIFDQLFGSSAIGGGGLDAAGVRSAIGLGSANLDSQLSGIKTKTDLIPSSPAASTDCLNAAGVRAAVGLGSANLDTQLAPLATGFARAVKAISLGTVDTGASATIIPTSSLTPTAGVADQFKGQVVCFANDTTTVNLRGAKTEITGSTSGGILSVNELPATPVSGDTFTIQ